MKSKRFMSTNQMVLGAVMTALVIVFQAIANIPTISAFASALALIPITIGACLCGPIISGWLGLVFSIVVFIPPNPVLIEFISYSPEIAVIVTIIKGVACGFAAGFVYKALNKVNNLLAIIVTAIVCPVTNTGVFMLGCLMFFYEDINTAEKIQGTQGVGFGAFALMILFSFLFELILCVVLTPTIVKLVKLRKKQTK